MYAIAATIQGSITAGSFNNGNDTFKVTSAGELTAIDGHIGGWKISSSDLSCSSSIVGMSTTSGNSDIAFWAGSSTKSNANFQVTQGGLVTCKNISVTGGSITGGSITLKDSSNNTVFSASSSGVTVNKGSITLKDSSNNTLFSASSSGVTVKGKITATELHVGSSGDLVDGSKLKLTTTNCTLASGLIDLTGKTISISQVTDLQTTLNGKYSTVANITLDNGGITMTGKSLTLNGSSSISLTSGNNSFGITPSSFTINGRTFNGTNLFARDDIVILKSTDDEGTVIQQHSSQHDWVLIKPYYNAEIPISFSGQYQYTTSPAAVAIKTVSEAESFLDGGRYWYKANLYYYTSEGNSRTFTVYLSNNTSFNPQVAISVNAGYAGSGGHYVDIPLTESAVNVCGANKTIYAKFYCNKAVTLNGGTNTITCYTNKTTSQVKCAVYYFP